MHAVGRTPRQWLPHGGRAGHDFRTGPSSSGAAHHLKGVASSVRDGDGPATALTARLPAHIPFLDKCSSARRTASAGTLGRIVHPDRTSLYSWASGEIKF